MMFGFGDSHIPNPETVRLVESIVLKQLRIIIQEALKNSDGKYLESKHLVFLMRRDKQKMRRFVRYLYNKKNKRILQSLTTSTITNHILNCTEKPTSELLEFIEGIDETGEFTDLTVFDEVKHQRELRADRISQALDENKYLDYCKARCASFSRETTEKSLQKLRLWVNPEGNITFEVDALDVLSYFAYQTVADIIDYALLVRTDTETSSQPLPESYYTATMFCGKHKFEEYNPDYSTIHSSQPAITVYEIKEVMRRVHSAQASKLNFGGRQSEIHYLFAL